MGVKTPINHFCLLDLGVISLCVASFTCSIQTNVRILSEPSAVFVSLIHDTIGVVGNVNFEVVHLKNCVVKY